MSYFSQKSWFGAENDQKSFFNEASQDLFSTQDLTAAQWHETSIFDSSQNEQKFFESHESFVTQSSINQSINVSSTRDSDDQNLQQASFFQSQLQTHLPVSQFIFNDESQEMEQNDVSEVFQESQQASSFVTRSNDIDDCQVPQSILHLYSTLRENFSDSTFISILAGQLCNEIFPSGAYKNLKLSLLLSLASINSGSAPIPIVAVGKETSHGNLIMNSIGQFADRFVTSLMNFEGSTVDSTGTIEAGPLLLAKSGVLFLGDWARLPQKSVMKLLREIENGLVTTEKVQQTSPLECAVWTFWSCSTKIKKDVESINQFMK